MTALTTFTLRDRLAILHDRQGRGGDDLLIVLRYQANLPHIHRSLCGDFLRLDL
jgi:hypothetical protein